MAILHYLPAPSVAAKQNNRSARDSSAPWTLGFAAIDKAKARIQLEDLSVKIERLSKEINNLKQPHISNFSSKKTPDDTATIIVKLEECRNTSQRLFEDQVENIQLLEDETVRLSNFHKKVQKATIEVETSGKETKVQLQDNITFLNAGVEELCAQTMRTSALLSQNTGILKVLTNVVEIQTRFAQEVNIELEEQYSAVVAVASTTLLEVVEANIPTNKGNALASKVEKLTIEDKSDPYESFVIVEGEQEL